MLTDTSNENAVFLFKDKKAYKTVYHKWHDMIRRCYNPKCKNYIHYGARNIIVCDEWKNKENGFINFCKWILSVGYDENKSGRYQSIDRINVNGNYEPNNCRLATPSIQNGNMRTKTKTGYKGVLLHTSGTIYYTSVKVEGVRYFVGQSKSKNECARMRNEYIIKHNLAKPLNEIKPELENILPTKINIFRAYDKNNNLLYEERKIKELSQKTKLSKNFIEECLMGIRNSKKFNFEKEVRIVYEY